MFMEILHDGESISELARLETPSTTHTDQAEEQIDTPQKSARSATELEDASPRSITSLSTSSSTHVAKRVSWSTAADESYDIMPYAEVYGVHPNEFDFDEFGR